MYTAVQSPAITQNTLLVMYTAVQLPANTQDSTITHKKNRQTEQVLTYEITPTSLVKRERE